MKQKILLIVFIASTITAVNAQKTSVYAITGSQKGQNNWTEVRLIDIATGEELKTIYKNSEETQPLNARTGKPVAKKEPKAENLQATRSGDGNFIITSGDNIRVIRRTAVGNVNPSENMVSVITVAPDGSNHTTTTIRIGKPKEVAEEKALAESRILEVTTPATVKTPTVIKEVESKATGNTATLKAYGVMKEMEGQLQAGHAQFVLRMGPTLDKPFSTYSAACAYDKKHDRLYYTPMGIAQLRYIRLNLSITMHPQNATFVR